MSKPLQKLLEYLLGQSSQETQVWLQENGYTWLAENWLDLVNGGIPVAIAALLLPQIIKFFKWLHAYLENKRTFKDLHPYFSYKDVENATKYFVPTRFQSVAPSLEENLAENEMITARQKLIPFMLKKALKYGADDQRLYLVLAGSGMGKTTFLINLLIQYRRQWKPFGKKYKIVLFPLAEAGVHNKIEAVPDKGNTILLLDALDEDVEAAKDYKARLDFLLAGDGSYKGLEAFREIVITCRTQFFPTEKDEPTKTTLKIYGGKRGVHTFRKLYVSPFDQKDIRSYLRKKYPWYKFKKRRQGFALVNQVPQLMVRPMLLSQVDDLLLKSAQEDTTRLTTSKLYQWMVEAWIERELKVILPKDSEQFRAEMHEISICLAKVMYQRRAEHQNRLIIPNKKIGEFLGTFSLTQLDEITVKGRSLLNRDAEGNYRFAHKSFFEYSLAQSIMSEPTLIDHIDFEGMDMVELFLSEAGYPEMIKVQGGTFKLGDEIPCTLSDFHIAKYPVTQAQWQAIMGENPSEFKGCPDCPVESVSWEDTQVFLQKLNAKTGLNYRLPTEAQWEFAARGGTLSRGYEYAGSNFIKEVAWYEENSGKKTHPVGQKLPNELGLYDMSGNVWEWCHDWYDEYTAAYTVEAQTPIHNPIGPANGRFRVLRGGAWYSYASRCRVSIRGRHTPSNRDHTIGFRLSRTP